MFRRCSALATAIALVSSLATAQPPEPATQPEPAPREPVAQPEPAAQPAPAAATEAVVEPELAPEPEPAPEPAPAPNSEPAPEPPPPPLADPDDPLATPPQDYATRDQRPPGDPELARSWAVPPSTEPEDYYLLLPRILLFPPNLVLKLIAMPIRGAAILIDRYHLIEHTKDLLYNDARTAGVLPAFGYQTGYGLTYGLKAFHNDLFGNDEELNVAAAFGGIFVQGYAASFIGDQIAHTPLWVEARAAYEVKPALFFQGIGNTPVPDATPGVGPRESDVATRFREARAMGTLTLGASIGDKGDRSLVGVTGLFNARQFSAERNDFDEPSIQDVYDTSQLQGFDDGATVLEITPTFVYDSRNFEATPSEGVYLDLFGGHTAPITSDADYWHYGAAFATFIDLYRGTRVLSIRTTLEAVHGDDDEIPFSELMKLGGPRSLRGYQLDRFRDKLSALATLEYRYPVHQMVSGEVFLDVGRVGQTYTEVFDRNGLEDFRFGGGLGFVFHSEDKIFFKAQAAYGEELLFFLSTDPLRTFRRRDKRL